MSYTTKAKIEKVIGQDIPVAYNTAITDWIASVKVWIDKYCGKTFEAASEDRYYDGNGLRELAVDSFVGSATVLILNPDGTTMQTLTQGQADDFVTWPYNDTEKNRLVLMSEASIGAFPTGKRRVKVTATFGGSSAVPADIELIAFKLVGSIYTKGQDGGPVSSETLGDYSVSFAKIDEEAEALGIYNTLNEYRDINI